MHKIVLVLALIGTANSFHPFENESDRSVHKDGIFSTKLKPKISDTVRPVGNSIVEKDKSLIEHLKEFITGEKPVSELDKIYQKHLNRNKKNPKRHQKVHKLK